MSTMLKRAGLDATCNKDKVLPWARLVITDALCCSAAEFSAAEFQDHGGMILGVDKATGWGWGQRKRSHRSS
jgi:hypothetical protein